MTHDSLLPGPDPTLLPEEPYRTVEAALAGGTAPADVAAAHPDAVLVWAVLAEQALSGSGGDQGIGSGGHGAAVQAYAYARTGYHRGLDALRRSGWKGHGPVPWSHQPNQGFLRALEALRRAAHLIGEDEEAERCARLLDECSPGGRRG